MTGKWRASGDDRGAVLIHVAFGVLALTAFTTFVADYGLLWVSRRQAQNSADAGAIAGATALGYDNASDFSDTGPAKTNALLATQMNVVWGLSPDVNVTTDITFPLIPAATCDPDGDGNSSCIRVDVYRNQARGNALPMLFGQVVGLTAQGIRATATALVMAANSSECTKPWAVADKWAELDGSWDPTDTFDPATGDDYRRQGDPTPEDPGTGFKAPPSTPNDYGLELTLKVGSPHDTINPGWFQALDLAGASDSTCINQGADCYRDAIRGCAGGTWKIGDVVPKENGNMTGPTAQGSVDLIALDFNADFYDPDGPLGPQPGSIINSCVGPPYTCSVPGFTVSPRVVAIPVFDLELYNATGGPGNGTVLIVNMLGFFVDRVVSGNVVGYLINKKETFIAGAGGVAGGASFIKAVTLIR